MNDDTAAPADPALGQLRAELRERIRSTSLNSVARGVEMSVPALEKFLSGGPILNSRRSRLSRWLRETERVAGERAKACVECVMILTADLPKAKRMPAVRAVLEALRREFKPGVGAEPLWLSRVIAAYEHPPSLEPEHRVERS